MQVQSIAECSKCSTFIKLPFVIKIFVLSIFEWLFYMGFTVCTNKGDDAVVFIFTQFFFEVLNRKFPIRIFWEKIIVTGILLFIL